MIWKPLLTLAVCLIGGILWAKSERNKRMVPIVIALIPFVDVVIVQIPAVQNWWLTHMQSMTTAAGGCTVGLGDFAFGGFLLGVIIATMRPLPIAMALIPLATMTVSSSLGLTIAKELGGLMVPQTPFVILGALFYLYDRRGYWLEQPDRQPGSPDVELHLAQVFQSEVKMMAVGWRLFAVLWLAASIVFIVRL